MAGMALTWRDRRRDGAGWARELGVSREAVELYLAAEVVDLHVESFLWTRVFGYDLSTAHGEGVLRARWWSQLDLPRMLEAGLSGAVFSIATNPLRRRRTTTLLANLARLRATLDAHPDHLAVVADAAGYRRARQAGRVACFLGVQGGNAFDRPEDLDLVPDDLVSRVTLVHLTTSAVGGTSSPLGRGRGLTTSGRALVEAMNARRILVDLAHASRAAFWDALDVHDRHQPAIVSHTGVAGVHQSWRNVDDRQLRAVAGLGGVVGIMYHCGFLGVSRRSAGAEAVVRHLEHVVRVAGEDAAALGSDWDGMIVTPSDMRTVVHLPLLVQRMLDRAFPPDLVLKIMGANYLRVLQQVRPGPP
ncbi:MAG: dipeptidase [Actinobacteria bacterium]|nr:dipeptidase [Actinomycetota bacterium]